MHRTLARGLVAHDSDLRDTALEVPLDTEFADFVDEVHVRLHTVGRDQG